MTKFEQNTPEYSSFPFYISSDNEPNGQYLVQPHWHEHMEIFKLVSGHVHIQIDEQSFHAREGDIFFIHNGQIHSASLTSHSTQATIQRIVFHRSLLHQPIADLKAERWITALLNLQNIENEYPITHSLWDTLNEGFAEILAEDKRKELGYELIVISRIYHMVTNILRAHTARLGLGISLDEFIAKFSRFKPALEYLENLDVDELSLKQLSEKANVSPHHFSKEFKSLFGMTPRQKIMSMRINKAKRLLLDLNLQVTDISTQLGFYDAGHFSKVFKQKTCFSPLQFRKRFNKL